MIIVTTCYIILDTLMLVTDAFIPADITVTYHREAVLAGRIPLHS